VPIFGHLEEQKYLKFDKIITERSDENEN
jgi:hypothetical protein